MTAPMAGRICLVTGATSGIGSETALGLARLGARVGLVGRERWRAQAMATRIATETGAQADVFVADLSSQAEVRDLGEAVRALYPRLDVLVNNAGAVFGRRETTVDGLERTWALDHLAYVLLTEELLPLLRAGAPARIVNVASAGHARGEIGQDPDGPRRHRPMAVYCRAKLGNVLFTYALARRLAGSGIAVNAVHPGVVASRFGARTGGAFGLVWAMLRPFMISPEAGARTSLHVACAPELAGVSGRYFARSRAIPSSPASLDEALQERVWAFSRAQVGLPPG